MGTSLAHPATHAATLPGVDFVACSPAGKSGLGCTPDLAPSEEISGDADAAASLLRLCCVCELKTDGRLGRGTRLRSHGSNGCPSRGRTAVSPPAAFSLRLTSLSVAHDYNNAVPKRSAPARVGRRQGCQVRGSTVLVSTKPVPPIAQSPSRPVVPSGMTFACNFG